MRNNVHGKSLVSTRSSEQNQMRRGSNYRLRRVEGGGCSEPAPPTKAGKNNGYRQTNARTVYIIKCVCVVSLLL